MAPHSLHEPDSCTMSSTEDMDIPILIVGGGATGLFLAHMLSRLGGKPKFQMQMRFISFFYAC